MKAFLSLTRPQSQIFIRIYTFNFKKQRNKQKNKKTKKQKKLKKKREFPGTRVTFWPKTK